MSRLKSLHYDLSRSVNRFDLHRIPTAFIFGSLAIFFVLLAVFFEGINVINGIAALLGMATFALGFYNMHFHIYVYSDGMMIPTRFFRERLLYSNIEGIEVEPTSKRPVIDLLFRLRNGRTITVRRIVIPNRMRFTETLSSDLKLNMSWPDSFPGVAEKEETASCTMRVSSDTEAGGAPMMWRNWSISWTISPEKKKSERKRPPPKKYPIYSTRRPMKG